MIQLNLLRPLVKSETKLEGEYETEHHETSENETSQTQEDLKDSSWFFYSEETIFLEFR